MYCGEIAFSVWKKLFRTKKLGVYAVYSHVRATAQLEPDFLSAVAISLRPGAIDWIS